VGLFSLWVNSDFSDTLKKGIKFDTLKKSNEDFIGVTTRANSTANSTDKQLGRKRPSFKTALTAGHALRFRSLL
jgi:hypothetical protein